MRLDNSSPRHQPHRKDEPMLSMGLSPVTSSRWIEPDDSLVLYHRHKLTQRQRLQDRVYRALPRSIGAQRELSAMLLEHLHTDHGDVYQLQENCLGAQQEGLQWPTEHSEPLWNASLWIADDLVIMQQSPDGYRLTAASLCSPSSWNLEQKFDRPLARIHDPIPDIHQQLTPAIERFFARIRPGYIGQRFNWTLQYGDALNQRPQYDRFTATDLPLYYRVERQTLRRLPVSNAIAFTIRVYVHPLEQVLRTAREREHLQRALQALPPSHAGYKGLDRLAPALAKYGISMPSA